MFLTTRGGGRHRDTGAWAVPAVVRWRLPTFGFFFFRHHLQGQPPLVLAERPAAHLAENKLPRVLRVSERQEHAQQVQLRHRPIGRQTSVRRAEQPESGRFLYGGFVPHFRIEQDAVVVQTRKKRNTVNKLIMKRT